jgi:hypothetical protein
VREIRTLTVLPPEEFKPQMQKLCRETGVVLALVPSIKGAHVSGVARWLNLITFFQKSLNLLLPSALCHQPSAKSYCNLSPKLDKTRFFQRKACEKCGSSPNNQYGTPCFGSCSFGSQSFSKRWGIGTPIKHEQPTKILLKPV